MNVKRFTGRNSREAMQKVRGAFGDDAVVLSTQPCSEGVEILAMAPESVAQIERFQDRAPAAPRADGRPAAPARAAEPRTAARPAAPRTEPTLEAAPGAGVQEDIGTLAMSTLSFQDYVRERMLRRREAELRADAERQRQIGVPASADAIEQRLAQREQGLQQALQSAAQFAPGPTLAAVPAPAAPRTAPVRPAVPVAAVPAAPVAARPIQVAAPAAAVRPMPVRRAEPPLLQEEVSPHALPAAPAMMPSLADTHAVRQEQQAMMNELRSMKGLIEERFGALAFMEKLQREPKQAVLISKLLDCGFSPALVRKLVEGLPSDVGDEMAWAGSVLERNLVTAEHEPALEDQGGVFALTGATGVGKTTSTAKIAAAFATKHGAANLGLVTLDAYRVGAHEQLRAYGRILGVPVHTAHDRTALEDLLDLLSNKKMVLIDTAGLAQRDSRTRELLDMLAHRSIQRLVVLNASSQGETLEDQMTSYRAASSKGVILSKLDEAVKLAPALDALIRQRQKIVAVANGQRVPEDWHRLSAQALVHRALRGGGSGAYRMDASEVNILFTVPPGSTAASLGRGARPRATTGAGA